MSNLKTYTKMKSKYDELEDAFSELCHVVGNKNLSNILIAERLKAEDILLNSREIAKVMMSFKAAFVSYRESLNS